MRRPMGMALVGLLAAGTVAAPALAADEPSVLVYSHTTVFRHDSIPTGIATIEELGERHGFTVEATEDPAVFTPQGLARHDAVVFLNTTGEVMPDDAARTAFEDYLRGGGGWVGIHAAADTEYDWPFYEQLLGGAYFLSHPLVNQPGTLDVEAHDHPSVAHLPERWSLPSEEYYSFTENPRGRVRVLMTIDESSYLQIPNTAQLSLTPFVEGDASPLETGVMGDHPMTWCRDVDAGRAWYTAIGHDAALYQRDDYREHLLNGILTAAGELPADCRVEATTDPGAPDADGPDADGPDADGPGTPTDPGDVDLDVPPSDAPAEPDPVDADPATAPAAIADGAASSGSLPATGAGWLPALGLALLGASLGIRRRTNRAG